MTDTLILKTIVEEKNRINAANKINGKNLVLEIITKDGSISTYKADSTGNFAKQPELINGALKIAVSYTDEMKKVISDVDGVCTETTTQPVTFDYFDPAEIIKFRYRFDLISTKVVEKTNLNTIIEGEGENESTNDGE